MNQRKRLLGSIHKYIQSQVFGCLACLRIVCPWSRGTKENYRLQNRRVRWLSHPLDVVSRHTCWGTTRPSIGRPWHTWSVTLVSFLSRKRLNIRDSKCIFWSRRLFYTRRLTLHAFSVSVFPKLCLGYLLPRFKTWVFSHTPLNCS